MSAWTCSLGWFRFTVSDSTADEVMARVGGEWIKDKKGFLGYRQGWLSRGHAGGLGRIGTAATWAPREVHVDLSQELISDWTYQKFQAVATWVFEKNGYFGRIDVALDDRNGVIDVDRIYAAVKAGNCVSHFRQSRLIAGLDLGSGSDTGKTLCMGSRHGHVSPDLRQSRGAAGKREVRRRHLDSLGNGMEIGTGERRGHGLVGARSGVISKIHRRGLPERLGFPGPYTRR